MNNDDFPNSPNIFKNIKIMNYGTYTEYKIKNWAFENFWFLKILQKGYINYKKYELFEIHQKNQKCKNYELWNVYII